ncbi:MAG: hypothetical protein M9919_00360 [Burkholderiaceae bacterium]|nr:hypothetical protein [Burkholderiaceae bacterium]
MKQTVKPELRDAILSLAARPDIHSISCPLVDFRLWQGLFKEQVARSDRLGLPLQEGLCLMGPDSGIPGVTAVFTGLEDDDCLPPVLPDQEGNLAPDRWGGEVHIPYEGVCGGDLFIPPKWLSLDSQALSKPDAKFHWVSNKRCNFLLLDRDLGELPHSVRSELVEGWWLYKSTSPFLDCNPFHDSAND